MTGIVKKVSEQQLMEGHGKTFEGQDMKLAHGRQLNLGNQCYMRSIPSGANRMFDYFIIPSSDAQVLCYTGVFRCQCYK